MIYGPRLYGIMLYHGQPARGPYIMCEEMIIFGIFSTFSPILEKIGQVGSIGSSPQRISTNHRENEPQPNIVRNYNVFFLAVG